MERGERDRGCHGGWTTRDRLRGAERGCKARRPGVKRGGGRQELGAHWQQPEVEEEAAEEARG
eukprot:3807207-Rhodomonas_salina.1